MTNQMLPFNKTLVILPTYNEIDNIKLMLETISNLYPLLSILIIDDNSPDGTAQAVKVFMRKNSKINIIERERKGGLGSAYVVGFKWALERNFQFVFEMDCDFSHDPYEIPKLLEAAHRNDLVIGSRYISKIKTVNWPTHRLFLSKLASLYTRTLTGINVLDVTGGFKCFTREALKSLDLDKISSNGYSFQIELNYKIWSSGHTIKEVPITFTQRERGVSKMSGHIIIEALLTVIKLRAKQLMGAL